MAFLTTGDTGLSELLVDEGCPTLKVDGLIQMGQPLSNSDVFRKMGVNVLQTKLLAFCVLDLQIPVKGTLQG